MSVRALSVTSVVVVVALGALTFAAVRVIEGLHRERLAATQREVDRAARHAATRHRVVQHELAQVAQRLARSEVVAWLGLVPDAPDTFASDYAKRLATFRPSATRSALEAEGRAFADACSEPAKRCLGRATSAALERARVSEAPASRPERAQIFEPDASAPAVVAEAVRARAIVRDFDRWPGTDVFHTLAAAPILEGGTLRGVVLVGQAVGGARLMRDAELVGASLTWMVSGTIGVAATTLDDPGALDTEAFITGREAIAGNVKTMPTVVAAVTRPTDDASLSLVLVALGCALALVLALVWLVPQPRTDA